jgi:predicted GH43/DUF377 family glycosyl hydrolase
MNLFLSSFLVLLCSWVYGNSPVVTATKRIPLEQFPRAHNPSIFKFEQGYLLIFRYIPDLGGEHWISYIGVALLNEQFDLISEPKLLTTRIPNSKTPSQAEDARIFSYRGRLFLIYNDNVDVTFPNYWSDRRDMFMAELLYKNGNFTLAPPLKLIYDAKYQSQLWQKNWVPFEHNKSLFFIYSTNPHEIILANLINGSCYHCYDTWTPLKWSWGSLRGSTPPQLMDGEHLAFFHSSQFTASESSWGMEMWHYFMGAYTFSAKPPFEMNKITPAPLMHENFYTPSTYNKRVVFPGGFVISGSNIYVAYGKDDCEVWIATIDKAALKESMIPVEKEE